MSPTAQEMDRLDEFLKPSLIAIVATIARDGTPQLTPNWYVFSEGKMAISTTKERVKYRNLARDNWLAVCVYSEPSALEYATLRGRAEISDDESIWPVTQAIVERYVSPDGVEARMRVLRTQNRVIIRMEPERVVFRM